MTSEVSLGLSGRRLLVVEDEYLIASDLAEWLESEGVQVMGPAPSVDEALGLLNTDALPDGAVLDVNLGDEQVFPVAEALRAADVPFVLLSGYDPRVIPEAYRDAPRCAKPLHRPALLRALATVLEG
jgi:CheY-like chemotaxis protein